MSDFKTQAAKTQAIYFRFGTQGNTKDLSPVLSLRVFVCGDEKLQANSIPRALNFVSKDGQGDLVTDVQPAVYMQYFTSAFPSCPPEKFDIVKEKGDNDYEVVTDAEL